MYRKVEDFLNDWKIAKDGTLKVLNAMTDESLDQSIVEGHNTLGWIGWHLTTAPAYFAGLLGLKLTSLGDSESVPRSAKVISDSYKRIAHELEELVKSEYTDDDMVEEVDMHGRPAPRGAILRILIDHQTHHRGQMTVLLRQAGLKVPGVMGPTKEDLAK